MNEIITDNRLVQGVTRDAKAMIVVALCVLLVDTLGQWALADAAGLYVDLTSLIIVTGGILFNSRARLWVGLGLLIGGVLVGSWANGVVWSLAGVIALSISSLLWVPRDRHGNPLGWFAQYVFVSAIGTLSFVLITSWFSVLLGWSWFDVALEQGLRESLPITIAGAPIVWALVLLLSEDMRGRSGSNHSSREFITGTVLVWAGGGYLLSFALRIISTVPSSVVNRRLSPVVETGLQLTDSGKYLTLIFGVAIMTVIIALLKWDDW